MKLWFSYLRDGLERQMPFDSMQGGKKKKDVRSSLKNLTPFFKRHWKMGVTGIVLIVVQSLLAMPDPLITRFLIDQVILKSQLSLLLLPIVLLIVVQAAKLFMNNWQQFFFARFEQVMMLDLQQCLFDRILRLPKSFFDTKETGYLMSRLLGDINGLRWFFSSTLVYIGTSILRFIGGCALLFYLNWRLASAVMLLLPFLILAVRYFNRRLHILAHHGMERQAEVFQSVQESLATTSLIKSFATEKRTLQRFMAKLTKSMHIGLEQTTLNQAAGMAINIVPELARLVVLLAGAYLIIKGQWSLGSLFAFQTYIGYVYGPAQYLASTNLQWQNALAALERVSALFDVVPEEKLGQGIAVKKLQGLVEFDSVTFSYNRQDTVLDDISFLVKPGEHVAIVGPSGVGKTTLISLLLQFYKVSKGEIRIDGRAVNEYELASLRQRIGYVPQETTLISGTILDNLCYGNTQASQAQVEQAAKIADIHDFIASLPEGYQARVGEKGVNFSEGQKQRLAMARALLKDSDILILDEPTAALDQQTEQSILDMLPTAIGQKTLFIVAHRRSTIQQVDRILVLNEKRLIANGAHSELQLSCAEYRSLFNDSNWPG